MFEGAYPPGVTGKMIDDYFDDRRIENQQDAEDIRQSFIREGFLDDMGFERSSPCRKCLWMKEGILEAFEDLADDDFILPGDVYDLARRMCAVCKAHTPEERDEALDAFWKEEDENVTVRDD